jgi:glycosyltransferase involved in cell wall biosynthesis
VLSNGIDLKYFNPDFRGRIKKTKPIITFTGVMDYTPNAEGVIWFVKDIFPIIKSTVPDATFFIIGMNPDQNVLSLSRADGVHVTGYVEDVRQYLHAADVCVVPLRIARGIQNKVLEAFAMGKPVVCTSQALEGIDAVPGEDLLVADDAEGFAGAVLELMRNSSLGEAIGKSARRFVESHHSWDLKLAALDKILHHRKANNSIT